MSTRSTSVRFPGSAGEDLAGVLVRPASRAPRAWALFAHCFTCSKDLSAAVRLSAGLAARGIAVLRFDFTGLGESAGDFEDTSFSSNVADLVAAAEWLAREHGAPRLLVGHSLGGAAVLAAAGRVPSVRAVATLGAPSEPRHLEGLLTSARERIEREGEAEVSIAGRAFRIRRELLEDLGRWSTEATAGAVRHALLVMHSPLDEAVGIEHARRIFEAARGPRSFVSLDDADHLLTRRADAAYAAEVLAAWAGRYVAADGAEEPSPTEEGEVVVASTDEPFAQEVRAGRHALLADEPASMGGGDGGPTPYDLLLAGLGACTAMTLRMYARHKGLDLRGVVVRLRHDRVHAADCEDCETSEGLVDRIERVVELEGELDDARRARLLEIANRCPVHRTLENEIRIPTRLA